MISVILIVCAAFFKAVMDILQFKYSSSVFSELNPSFWNPQISWLNKYKDADPQKGEAFLGSTTVFVLFTDAWHLFQSLFLFCVLCAIPVYVTLWGTVIDLFLFNIIFRFIFEISFKGLIKTI